MQDLTPCFVLAKFYQQTVANEKGHPRVSFFVTLDEAIILLWRPRAVQQPSFEYFAVADAVVTEASAGQMQALATGVHRPV